MSNAINHKRVMLANLRIGQCISYITFSQGQRQRVVAEIIKIKIEQNYGQLWTRQGLLPKELLTFKYEVVNNSIVNTQKVGI
jgi:hypothetical protein